MSSHLCALTSRPPKNSLINSAQDRRLRDATPQAARILTLILSTRDRTRRPPLQGIASSPVSRWRSVCLQRTKRAPGGLRKLQEWVCVMQVNRSRQKEWRPRTVQPSSPAGGSKALRQKPPTAWGRKIVTGSMIAAFCTGLYWLGHALDGLHRAHAFTCQHAPEWTWLFPKMECPQIAQQGDKQRPNEPIVVVVHTPVKEAEARPYAELREKFLAAARDGDDAYVQSLVDGGFRLRPAELCTIVDQLAGAPGVSTAALNLLDGATDPSTKCASINPFGLERYEASLPRFLLDEMFGSPKCDPEKGRGYRPVSRKELEHRAAMINRIVQKHGQLSEKSSPRSSMIQVAAPQWLKSFVSLRTR